MQSVTLLCEKRRNSYHLLEEFASDILGMLLNFINCQHKQLFGPVFGYFQLFGRSRMVVKLAGIRPEPDTVFGTALVCNLWVLIDKKSSPGLGR